MPEAMPNQQALEGKFRDMIGEINGNPSLRDKINYETIVEGMAAIGKAEQAPIDIIEILNTLAQGGIESTFVAKIFLNHLDTDLHGATNTDAETLVSVEELPPVPMKEKLEKLAGFLDEGFSQTISYEVLSEGIRSTMEAVGIQVVKTNRVNRKLGRLLNIIAGEFDKLPPEWQERYTKMALEIAGLADYDFE